MDTRLFAVRRDSSGQIGAGWRIAAFLLLMLPLAALALLVPVGDPATPTGLVLLILRYALLVPAVAVPACLLLRWADRAPVATLGLGLHRRSGIELAQGLGLGLLMIGSLVALEGMAGWLSLGRGQARPGPLFALLLLAMVAAAGEELLFRGYPFQVLAQRFGPAVAVAVTSVLFGAAHSGNPNASLLSFGNTALAGLLLAIAYLRVGSLWLPISLHAAWNYGLGALFGLPVSGLEAPPSLLRSSLTEAGERLQWLTGGAYGPEGGLVLTLVVTLAIVAVARLPGFESAPGIEPLFRRSRAPADRPTLHPPG